MGKIIESGDIKDNPNTERIGCEFYLKQCQGFKYEQFTGYIGCGTQSCAIYNIFKQKEKANAI